MHCLKTLNIEHDYGTTRLFLLSGITFVLVFCFSYIGLSYGYTDFHTDRFSWIVVIVTPFIYPLHKGLHYLSLLTYRRMLIFRLKIRYLFVPIIQIRLQQPVSKSRYLLTLVTPLVVLNGLLIAFGLYMPQYAHYMSFLLAFHTSICLIDLLYVKHLIHAPRNAVIEETPKGYEVLVPLS